MGLIKTGLTLAGGYGLIKAASKAANDYQDKKAKRNSQTQPQCYPHHQYQPGHEYKMGYMHSNQKNSAYPQSQSRAVESRMKHEEPMGDYPPSYQQAAGFELHRKAQCGPPRNIIRED